MKSKHRSTIETGFCVKKENEFQRICDHAKVIAFCSREGTDERSALIEFKDGVTNQIRCLEVPFSTFQTPHLLSAKLASYGFVLPTNNENRNLLALQLAQSKPEKRLRYLTQIGWYKNSSFILPEKTIGAQSSQNQELVYGGPCNENIPDYSIGGTLKAWRKEVAGPIGASSRGILAVCSAFAAATLEPMNEENFGVHLYGETSSGKSICLLAARSVAGRALRNRQFSWNNTPTGFEEVATASNSNALITDESQLGADDEKLIKKSRQIAYEFVSGQGKARSYHYSSQHGAPPSRWYGILLSAGETSFAALGIAHNDPRKGGEVHRLIDLPAVVRNDNPEYGIFEKIPDNFDNTAEAAEAIEQASTLHHGHALREFVIRWLEDSDAANKAFTKKKRAFTKYISLENAVGWERRFGERFSIIYAGGSLAGDWGILPWSKQDIAKAIRQCYRAARKNLENSYPVPEKLLRKLQKKVKRALDSTADPTSSDAQGVTLRKKTSKLPPGILIPPAVLETWFITNVEQEALLKKLKSENLIVTPPGRRGLKIQVRVGGGKESYYLLRRDLLKLKLKAG